MSRNLKLGKLSNAVRDWRGKYDAQRERWIKPPQPQAVQRVARWMVELGMDARATLQKVAAFKTYQEFNAWLAKQ